MGNLLNFPALMSHKNKMNRRSLLLKELSLVSLGIIVTGWSVRELTLGASSSVSVGVSIISVISSSSSSGGGGTTVSLDRQSSSTTQRNPSKILALIQNSIRFAVSDSTIEHAAPDAAPKEEESAQENEMQTQEYPAEDSKNTAETKNIQTTSVIKNTPIMRSTDTTKKVDLYRMKKNATSGGTKSVSGNTSTPTVSLDTCTLGSYKCVKEAFAADSRLIADVISDILPFPSMKFIEQLPATEPILWALGVFWLALITRGTLLVVTHYR